MEVAMQVIKRDGTIVEYNSEKINLAISKANGNDSLISDSIIFFNCFLLSTLVNKGEK